ncbi:CID domain [Dillenia turbinata]|uniref:CID domain n=1 Tax=Dillenia turbinata TaxID=194707 RepID=A0AAN8UY49_9MAGN
MSSVFSEQILADKLSKLNSTQQCIETLSHWCIFHRSKAELVVTTWDKQFHASEMAQKVPLLYLANDILQNSKRKGNEFVNEFWKVLPTALKDVIDKGDDHGKNVVSRLVDIWEQRRVFGSRKSLKDIMFGEEAPPPLELSKKRSRSVRIVKRDSRSIRTKLTIGGTAEKIVSAFHLVLSDQTNEESEMSKCQSTVHHVQKLEKDVDVACSQAKDPRRKTLAKELKDDENILRQCIEQLKSVEATRLALVHQLKEALHEQESELENVRTQMQVAQAQAEEASIMQKWLNDENYVASVNSTATPQEDANAERGQAPKKSAAAIAAEVADKLAASTSSQYIMTSVLSTFAAEEAKNAALTKSGTTLSNFSSIPNNFANDKMSKAEKPVQVSDPNSFLPAPPLPVPPSNPYQTVLLPQPTIQNPASTAQTQYHVLPNPPSQQFVQPSGVLSPYGYGGVPPLPPGPPPPPPPAHMMSPMMPLQMNQPQPVQLTSAVQMPQQPMQITQQQPIPLVQQPPVAPSFRPLQPPVVYYGNQSKHQRGK